MGEAKFKGLSFVIYKQRANVSGSNVGKCGSVKLATLFGERDVRMSCCKLHQEVGTRA